MKLSQSRVLLLALNLAWSAGCNSNDPTGNPSPESTSQTGAVSPASGMKWAETTDFRGEVPVQSVVMPQGISPSAVDTFTTIRSGLMIGIPRSDPKANPLPLVFSIVLVSPKLKHVSEQFALDSLLEVCRRNKAISDESIQLGGHAATRIITITQADGLKSFGVFALTPKGVVAITADYLPAEDFDAISSDLNRFVSTLKFLP